MNIELPVLNAPSPPHWLDMLDDVWREQLLDTFAEDDVEFIVNMALESADEKWKPRKKHLKRLEELWRRLLPDR